jgi:hypothetical protein
MKAAGRLQRVALQLPLKRAQRPAILARVGVVEVHLRLGFATQRQNGQIAVRLLMVAA